MEVERWGFINAAGELVIPPRWDDADEFHEGFARVRQDGKSGFIDVSGQVVVPLNYDNWDDTGFTDGLALVELAGKWGFIDRMGRTVVPLEWDDAAPFHEGLAAVKLGDMWGCIGRDGHAVCPPQWSSFDSFAGGIAKVESGDKHGFIDHGGRFVDQSEWGYVGSVSEGRMIVTKGGPRSEQLGIMDTPGTVVLVEGCRLVGEFHEGLAAAVSEQNGRYGFIDPEGKMVISPRWYYATAFCGGFAVVGPDHRREGFIDRTGKEVISPQDCFAGSFVDGLAPLSTTSGLHYWSGVIDTAGRFVVPPCWRETKISHGCIFARGDPDPGQGQSYAWYDHAGRLIWHSGPLPTSPQSYQVTSP